MDDIVVVSGLPRSGTSMMMQILEAGGFPILTDYLRTADTSNPKGYYEYERVKKLKGGDMEWVQEARGKAVKVISDLLEFLPAQYSYKVIFMQRHVEEVLASQRKMLLRRGEDAGKISDEQFAGLYTKHLAKVQAWLSHQPNMNVFYVSYNEVLENPERPLNNVNLFLGDGLDIPRMCSVVDTILYRNRTTE